MRIGIMIGADGTRATIDDVVERAIHGMDRLIRDLLDVSRLEADGLSVDRSAVPVAPLLADLCEQFEELARSKRLRLECRAAEGLPPVFADRMRLNQVRPTVRRIHPKR